MDQPQNQIPCNLCGGKENNLLYVIFNTRIVRCRRCNLVYVSPRGQRDEILGIYDDNYFENSAYRISDEAQYFGYNEYVADEENITRKFIRKIKTIERFRRPGDLLDVGCACGFFMKLARTKGWRVSGVEPSRYAYEYASKRFGFDIYNGFLEDAHYPAGSFDALTMWDVIEHLADPLGSLLEANRVMRKGAILGIITPDIGSFLARLLRHNWLEIKRVKEHIYFFSYATLNEMLKRANFRIMYRHTSGKYVKLKTIISELDFMHWPGTDRLLKWIQGKRFGERSFYVNPHYKMAVYAQKIGPAER